MRELTPKNCRNMQWLLVESSWNVMAHGDAREGKWRGNWRMECVACTLYTTSKHDVSSITTITIADEHTSPARSRLNGRPRRFKWTRPFHRKTKSGFCACAIFQMQSKWPASHPACFNAREHYPPPQLGGTCSLFGHDVEKKKIVNVNRTPISRSSNPQPNYNNDHKYCIYRKYILTVTLLKYFIFAHSALWANTFDFTN
jgi:hypothetical protein